MTINTKTKRLNIMTNFISEIATHDFSVLPNETLRFSPNINIITDNYSCASSHILKLLYSLLKVTSDHKNKLTKTELQKSFAKKITNVFRPDYLGRLSNCESNKGKTEIAMNMGNGLHNIISFSRSSSSKVKVETINLPENQYTETPIFIPNRELITFCPWFTALYNNQNISFEETWFDTCTQLNLPLAKGERETEIRKLANHIEQVMNGKLIEEQGRFYLSQGKNGKKVEAALLPEGLKMIAMLLRLIQTGVLLNKGYLFIDKPETSIISAELIDVFVNTICELSKNGVQVFMTATDNSLLLQECQCHMMSKSEENTLKIKVF